MKIGAGLSIFEAIKKEPSSSNRRRMASLTGNKYVIVVIGDATDHAFNPSKYTSYEGIDAKATAVSEDVFGGGSDVVNMKSQFDACSFGELQIIPEPDPAWINEASSQTFSAADLSEVESAPGVVTVSLDILIDGASESDIRNEFLYQAISKMDVDGSKGLVFPGPFDHVIYARHACYGGDCGWAACEYPSLSWYLSLLSFLFRYLHPCTKFLSLQPLFMLNPFSCLFDYSPHSHQTHTSTPGTRCLQRVTLDMFQF